MLPPRPTRATAVKFPTTRDCKRGAVTHVSHQIMRSAIALTHKDRTHTSERARECKWAPRRRGTPVSKCCIEALRRDAERLSNGAEVRNCVVLHVLDRCARVQLAALSCRRVGRAVEVTGQRVKLVRRAFAGRGASWEGWRKGGNSPARLGRGRLRQRARAPDRLLPRLEKGEQKDTPSPHVQDGAQTLRARAVG